MSHFDTSSHQLELVDRLYAAYCTRDIKNAWSLLAREFRYKSLPEHPELPEETKEEHFEMYGKKNCLMYRYGRRCLIRRDHLQVLGLTFTAI